MPKSCASIVSALTLPRICGEKPLSIVSADSRQGSPPHARGKGRLLPESVQPSGITPACAGKSLPCPARQAASWDHPRMRGEKWADVMTAFTGQRITPACAGKSSGNHGGVQHSRDHPRVRGEKPSQPSYSSSCLGSPPRARGKVCKEILALLRVGITPACAGKRSAICAIP